MSDTNTYHGPFTFEIMFPNYKDKIIDSVCIGDFETIFYMSDGDRVIFNDMNKTAKYIEARPNTQTELSKEEWSNEFSRKLKLKLSIENMTRKELSIQTGIAFNTICRYVKGERIPDIYSIYKISKALNREIKEFIDFDYLL